MKKRNAIAAIIAVGALCIVAGYYLAVRYQPQPSLSFRIMRYSELGLLPEIVQKVDAKYPPAALKNRLEGNVVIEVTIGEDGFVKDAGLSMGGPKELGEAAIEAARLWKFKPVIVEGKPKSTLALIPFAFRLDSSHSTSGSIISVSKSDSTKSAK